MEYAEAKADATQALASHIYSGVTTAYDAGNQADVILPLRADELVDWILSPRIASSTPAT